MKITFLKTLFIIGIVFLILFISKDQKVLASERYSGIMTHIQITYDIKGHLSGIGRYMIP